MKKIIFFVSALLVFGINILAQDDTRVTAAWQVKKYDISISPSERTLNIKAGLDLLNVGNGNGSRLTLRITPNAEVSAVQVNGSMGTFTKGEEKLGSSGTLQRVIVSLPGIAPKGTVNVVVDYKLKVNENSGLNAITPFGMQFLPMSFWYPTPTGHFAPRGADFAPFRLMVNATNETLVSSGKAVAGGFEQNLNGQPFFVSGSFETVTLNNVKGIEVLLTKGFSPEEKKKAEDIINVTSNIKAYLNDLLGNADFPIKIVKVRRGAGFADGGTILLENGAFRRSKMDSQTIMTIAESLAKVWLGNIKSVKGEGYGVIRDGLSRYLATQFLEKQFGKDVADIERYRQRNSYSTVVRNESPLNQSAPLDSTYFSSVSNKGAMIWRILASQVGETQLFNLLKGQENLSLNNVKTLFDSQKALLDYHFDQVTDLNLMVGLPQAKAEGYLVAMRNLGSIEVTVNVVALNEKGEKIINKVTLPAKSFGETTFKSTSKIVRVEVDPEKLYPQTEYFDDIAPKDFNENNPFLPLKRAFDKQEYQTVEKLSRSLLQSYPRFDEVRTWLGRSLAAQNKLSEAEKEFKLALEETLPTVNTLAWANLGLGEIALASSQNAKAAKHFQEAILADAEYGATLAARLGRQKAESQPPDDSVKVFFQQFDKVAVSGKKSELDNFVLSGEITRFSSGVVTGQPEKWETKVIRTEKLDANLTVAETFLTVKRLGNEVVESGTAIFILSKSGQSWKIAGVEVFEVR